jgi:ADP-ribosylglycohydrolase
VGGKPKLKVPPAVGSAPAEVFKACLLGGAIGDALGAPVEFMSRDQICSRFGAGGLRDFADWHHGLGAITDDTQMTLFTAEAVIQSHRENMPLELSLGIAYQCWLSTQQPFFRSHLPDGTPVTKWSRLLKDRRLKNQRAPGLTCLDALESKDAVDAPATNTSKGCGGVMRVAPIGLFVAKRDSAAPLHRVTNNNAALAFQWGCWAAQLTHGHPTGFLSAGAFAAIICQIALGHSLSAAIETSLKLVCAQPQHKETSQAIKQAVSRATADKQFRQQSLTELGHGWVAEEALAMSLYCSLTAKSFSDGVIYAVNHDGDSDSTGAITGNLLGCLFGLDGIPSNWRASVECADLIEQIASDLAELG